MSWSQSRAVLARGSRAWIYGKSRAKVGIKISGIFCGGIKELGRKTEHDRSGKWKADHGNDYKGLYQLGFSIVVSAGLISDGREPLRGLSMPGHQF